MDTVYFDSKIAPGDKDWIHCEVQSTRDGMALKMLKAAYYQDEEAVQLAARASRGEYRLGLMI